MSSQDLKSHYIRVAGTIALLGNAALAATKLVLGHLSSSLAVMGDAIDSSTDVLIALVTIVISGVISRPGDDDHPWGHERAESTATLILSFVIFYAGAQLVIKSAVEIFSLIKGALQKKEISRLAIYAALISIAGKSILAAIQFHYGKISDSEIVKANAQNMKSDIILSAGILLGLGAAFVFRQPLLDPIIALCVGCWVVKNAVEIFRQINLELMDGNIDNSLYKKLFEAAAKVPGVTNPHRARIRKMASFFDIDLDIEVDPSLTVFDAHELSEQVEENVRLAIPEVYDIVIHIEPAGSDNHQREEKFGLRAQHD